MTTPSFAAEPSIGTGFGMGLQASIDARIQGLPQQSQRILPGIRIHARAPSSATNYPPPPGPLSSAAARWNTQNQAKATWNASQQNLTTLPGITILPGAASSATNYPSPPTLRPSKQGLVTFPGITILDEAPSSANNNPPPPASSPTAATSLRAPNQTPNITTNASAASQKPVALNDAAKSPLISPASYYPPPPGGGQISPQGIYEDGHNSTSFRSPNNGPGVDRDLYQQDATDSYYDYSSYYSSPRPHEESDSYAGLSTEQSNAVIDIEEFAEQYARFLKIWPEPVYAGGSKPEYSRKYEEWRSAAFEEWNKQYQAFLKVYPPPAGDTYGMQRYTYAEWTKGIPGPAPPVHPSRNKRLPNYPAYSEQQIPLPYSRNFHQDIPPPVPPKDHPNRRSLQNFPSAKLSNKSKPGGGYRPKAGEGWSYGAWGEVVDARYDYRPPDITHSDNLNREDGSSGMRGSILMMGNDSSSIAESRTSRKGMRDTASKLFGTELRRGPEDWWISSLRTGDKS